MPTTIAKEPSNTFCEFVSAEIVSGIFKINKKGKVGLVRTTGETICPCIYDEIEVANDNFKVRIGRYWGVMDVYGNLLCPCNYLNLLYVDKGGVYCEMDEDVYYIRFNQ